AGIECPNPLQLEVNNEKYRRLFRNLRDQSLDHRPAGGGYVGTRLDGRRRAEGGQGLYYVRACEPGLLCVLVCALAGGLSPLSGLSPHSGRKPVAAAVGLVGTPAGVLVAAGSGDYRPSVHLYRKRGH